jgi:pyridoxamine 5'-phosphate oxidase
VRLNKEEMFELMRANPAFHLATVEGDQPRCRGMFLYRADEKGIVFHSGAMKTVHRQISANPRVELCFNDFKTRVQVRVAGSLQVVDDKALMEEIYAHPSRQFLKPWREAGPLKDFYNTFKVYRLAHGKAVWWTAERNFAPKEEIEL